MCVCVMREREVYVSVSLVVTSGYVLCNPMKSASMIVLFLGSYAVVLSTKSAEISYPMVCGVATDCE